MSADPSRPDPAVVRLHPRAEAVEPTNHFVEFYDSDPSLIASVGKFISVGIGRGEPAVVVAEPAHIEGFERSIERTVDLRAARRQGLYVSRDAQETLSLFMGEDLPDPIRFDRILGDLIRQMAANGRNIRIFGEMVAVLWARGNVAGALALEDLWNELGRRHPFRLFCAYPTRALGEINQAPLDAVVDRHSHVLLPSSEGL